MKHVSIIVPQGDSVLSSIIGPYKVLTGVNNILIKKGKQAVFEVHLVGLGCDTHLYGGLFSVHPDTNIKDVVKTDLVIIPAVKPESLHLNAAFISWVTEQYKRGAEVASLCVGAFLLASTGLLKGKKCTTHWMAAEYFRQQFPEVKLVAEKVVTDEHGIYTSGGAYTFVNLLLHITEKYCGRDVAIQISKQIEVDIDRETQAPFTIFTAQKEHEDEPIKKVQEYIESNIDKKISVEQLAGLALISKRNFERRFKKATANTPVEYLQRVKIEAARRSLETGRENINEVMYAVGYSDSKAFRTVFKKITGLSPLDYRRKFNREMAV